MPATNSVDERNEGLASGWIVQKLVFIPFMVMSSSGDECGLGEQPPHQASQRPGHDGPPKPLQTLSEVIGTGDEVEQRPLWNDVLLIFAPATKAHELEVCGPIDHEPDDEENQSDNESRIVVVASAVFSGPDKLGIDVVVQDIGKSRREGNPKRHFRVAVLSDERVYDFPVDVVHYEEAVEQDVDWQIKVLSGDKVGDGKDNDARDYLRNDEGNAGIDRKSSAALSVFAIRGWLENLAEESYDCKHKTYDHQAKVDPETDVVVSSICYRAGLSFRVIGKEEVGYTIEDTDPSITGYL